jgi:outer membrane protein assembly factor BamB
MAAELRDDNPGNWPIYNRTYDGTRYSPLNEIAVDNVQNLQVAWIAQFGNIREGLMETPLVIDGVVYSIGSMNRVQALEAATGKEIWHYYPRLDEVVNEIFFRRYLARLGVWRRSHLLWYFGRARYCFGRQDRERIVVGANRADAKVWWMQFHFGARLCR